MAEIRAAGNGSDHAAIHGPFVEQRYSPHPLRAGMEGFRSLVERRLDKEGLQLLFGKKPAGQGLVDDVIAVCGGHFRDLLRLLRDTVVRATSLPSLPVPAAVIAHTINAARRDFLPIAQDDARWLAEIARVRATALPSTEATPVNRLARFLDSHFVLILSMRTNGTISTR
jgi:hypothetical protein